MAKEVVEIDVKVNNGDAPDVLAKGIRGAKSATEELTDAQKDYNTEQSQTEETQRDVNEGFAELKKTGVDAISKVDAATGKLASSLNETSKNIRGARSSTERLTAAQKRYNEQQRKTEERQREVKKGFSEISQVGGSAISSLDTLTGGLASGFLSLVKNIRTATVGLKGMQAVAAASGIFTLMVLIPAIVEQISQLIVTEEEEADIAKKNADAKKAQADELNRLAEAYDKVSKAQQGGVNQLQRELAELQAAGGTPEEIYAKKLTLLQAERRDLLSQREFFFDNAEKVAEFNQKILDNESQQRIAKLEKDKAVEAQDKALQEKRKTEREKLRQEEFEKNNRLQQDEEERIATNAKLKEDALNKEREDRQAAQNFMDEYADEEIARQAAEAEAAEANAERLKKIEENKTEFIKKEQEKRKKAQLDAANAAFDLALMGIETLQMLNESFTKDDEASKRKAFENDKKLKIVGTIIGTSQAIMNQLATLPAPFGQISAGLVALQGVAQVNNIRKQQFDSPSTSPAPSAASMTTASQIAPTFSVVGQNGINQLAESVAGRQNQPVQVYVTSGQVTSAASLERRRIRNATFG